MVDLTDDKPALTLTKTVYEQLRNDVLRGHLKPGQKLAAEALRKRFNTGSSPVREALNRLLAEGFVALEEQKGFRVAAVSTAELSELVSARCWIDGTAITEAIHRRETAWEEALVLALHRLTRTSRKSEDGSENTEWETLHKSFHMDLVRGCANRWIIHTSEQLFDAAERYRLLGADRVSERNELNEHKAIVDACLDHRADLAVDLIRSHYNQTFEVIVGTLKP